MTNDDKDITLDRRTLLATTTALALASGALPGADKAAAHGAMEVVQRDIDVPTPDGVADCALAYPAGAGRWPAVLVWTDIRGLRPVFRELGRRLAAQGYVVLVPNPFYRQKRAPVVDEAFDITKPEDRAKIMPLAAALTPESGARDSAAFLAFLDGLPQADRAKKAGVQGYCMGGPLAFRTAAACPDRIAAAATFHGGGLVSDKPASPHLLIPLMRATVYCAVADNDDKKDPSVKTVLRESFAAAHRPAEIVLYAGANHGWCMADSHSYDHAAAERAWAALGELYARMLI